MAGTTSITREKRTALTTTRTPQAQPHQITGITMSKRPRTRDDVGHYTCPNCGSSSLVRDAETGEVICTNCGFVLSDPNEQFVAPVPRRTEEGLLESQSGPPGRFSAFDKNLSTIISRAQASNRSLSADERLQLWRLRRTQLRASAGSSMARNLSRAMSQLRGLAGRLNLPEVVTERAALMYRRALNKGLVRGRPINGMVAASTYAACRLTDVPRSLSEIAKASGMSRKLLAHYYRALVRSLDVTMAIEDPLKRVSKISSRAGADSPTEILAGKILREAIRLRVNVGKDPDGLAAAALDLAARIRGSMVMQRDLAKAAGVSEVTIRSRMRDLKAAAKSLGLPDVA
jgi:transcription initiation factor TFIIB